MALEFTTTVHCTCPECESEDIGTKLFFDRIEGFWCFACDNRWTEMICFQNIKEDN